MGVGVGMGGVGGERLGATIAASLAGIGISSRNAGGTDRAQREVADKLKAFENAVLRLWPAYCHIDAQRRRAGVRGFGERYAWRFFDRYWKDILGDTIQDYIVSPECTRNIYAVEIASISPTWYMNALYLEPCLPAASLS